MQFFGYGAIHNERLLAGGNRCLTPWTVIPTGHGERQVCEVLDAEAFDVQAWDGETLRSRRSGNVFLKGIEPAFRIHLDNGEVFECSRKHRVLMPEGQYHSFERIMSRPSVLHLSRTLQGWKANCASGDRPYDRPLLEVQGSDLTLPRKLRGAPSSAQSDLRAGAAASKFARNRVCRPFDRRAIEDAPSQLSALNGISEWAAPVAPRSALPKFPAAQFVGKSPEYIARLIADWQFEILQLLDQCESVYLACSPILLHGGNSIVAVAEIGPQPIVDFEVPGFHNYMAAGVVHHNSGKSVAGCYEDTLHLTGQYPDWWPGKRFDHPVDAWIAGDTAKTVRDILQTMLCGPWGDKSMLGTGMIPGDLILNTTVKHGLSDAFEAVFVKHAPTGGTSMLQFKSYDQGRTSYQGTSQHLIHLDEEPPLDIYTECLLRTMTVDGIISLTATPLSGLTDLLIQFLPEMAPAPEVAQPT